MKRLMCTLLMMSAMVLTGCSLDIKEEKADPKQAQQKLTAGGYTVQVMNEAEAKAKIKGLVFSTYTVETGIYAEKTVDDKTDFLIAFYFSKGEEANDFFTLNDGGNGDLLDAYAESIVGKENKMLGIYNNVIYAGSVTSYKIAGLTAE